MSEAPPASNDDTPTSLVASQQRRLPPERPGRTSSIPSPLGSFEMARPRILTLSVVLWLASCLAGIAIIAYFVTRLDTVRTLLEPAVRERDPSMSQSTLDNWIVTIVGACLGLVGLTVVLQLWLASLMARQRNWARVLLAIVGTLGLVASSVTCVVLTDGMLRARPWLIVMLAAQALLALFAYCLMVLPQPTRWFHLRLRR